MCACVYVLEYSKVGSAVGQKYNTPEIYYTQLSNEFFLFQGISILDANEFSNDVNYLHPVSLLLQK